MKGARQVGKTWLMKEFGKNYYDSYVYFNFDEEDGLKFIFEVNKMKYFKEQADGYHVMERESFEKDEIAEILNKDYVSVKVDREERPDVDSVYMSVCQAMNGQGLRSF